MKLILLIDDNEQIRVTFGVVLRDNGYRVIESDSGEAGLELARQQMPDVILSDVHMPGGGGEALLKQIRADPELCTKQVVLMTGRPDLISPRSGMEQGADDFLVKPVSMKALLSCMEARVSRGDLHWRLEDRALTKMRSSMTSHLPHEFFTPLAGILGISELLTTQIADLTPKEIQDFTSDLRHSALRLHRTLKNYLLILETPTESDATSPAPDPLPPTKVEQSLKSGIDLAVERQGRREDLTFKCEECQLLASSSDLEVIVEELVDNAFKFSRRGSPVTVHLQKSGLLSVLDSGRGMSPEEIKEIGAFRQFDRKQHEQQGLGLGLFLVQKLTARNEARFSIESRPEQGVQAQVQFKAGNSV